MRDALRALTVRGRAFLAAGATTTACAIVLGYDALMRVGVLAIALPFITAALVGRVRYRLLARRNIEPARVVCDQPAQAQLNLVNQGRLPAGMLLFEDHLPRELGTSQRFTVDRMGPSWHRTVTYALTPTRRGHYDIGPLSVRISDPFGFIELTRSFRTTSRLVVTPRVVPLPASPLDGATAESGEQRRRAASVGNAEDVTVREYRQGDDLRRVHWNSTARLGQLMVRREEEPWQNRATVLLDTRRGAHTVGSRGTLEWAVDASASIGVHLGNAGYGVQLLTERPTRPGEIPDTSDRIVDELAALAPTERRDFADLAAELIPPRGLVVAVLGRCTTRDLDELNRSVAPRARRLALLLDRGGEDHLDPNVGWLFEHGWQAVSVRADSDIARAWGQLGAAATTRSTPTPVGSR